MAAELARTDLQDGVAELRQERSALLLTLALPGLGEQLDDQRALATDVRDDERTDLAVRAEAMRMQGGRLQEPAQPVVESGDHERRLALRGRSSAAINWVEC